MMINVIKPGPEGKITEDDVDRILNSKPSKDVIFNSIEYPKCKNCGKEFHRFFGRRLPSAYEQLCDDCARKEIQQITDDTELLAIYKILDEYCNDYLSTNQLNKAWDLYQKEKVDLEHKKYITEIENLAKKAGYEEGDLTSNFTELLALLLERIDESISDNSYRSDPRNIVFNV